MADKTKEEKSLFDSEDAKSFGEAMTELERILRKIEDEQIDIDALGNELKQATELLELCRAKIRKAEVEVTQIVQSLDASSNEDDD